LTKLPTIPIEQGGQSPRKYRYGAWYLPKNLWRRSLTTEELRDPDEIKAELEDETRKREEHMVKSFTLSNIIFLPILRMLGLLHCMVLIHSRNI